jgi:hypothetical protein
MHSIAKSGCMENWLPFADFPDFDFFLDFSDFSDFSDFLDFLIFPIFQIFSDFFRFFQIFRFLDFSVPRLHEFTSSRVPHNDPSSHPLHQSPRAYPSPVTRIRIKGKPLCNKGQAVTRWAYALRASRYPSPVGH